MLCMTQNVTESEGKYMDAQKIGKRLVALRGARRREEVATAVGISFSALCMYETGRRIARDDVKIALCAWRIFFSRACHEKRRKRWEGNGNDHQGLSAPTVAQGRAH